jgi:hypothetical protein
MNDAIWIKFLEQLPSIIAAVASVITAIGVIVVGYFAYKSKQQGEKNEIQVAEVKTALVESDTKHEEKLNDVHITGERILKLVNSNMRDALNTIYQDKARLFKLTDDPADKVAMDAAKTLLQGHDDKQAEIDNGEIIREMSQ